MLKNNPAVICSGFRLFQGVKIVRTLEDIQSKDDDDDDSLKEAVHWERRRKKVKSTTFTLPC